MGNIFSYIVDILNSDMVIRTSHLPSAAPSRVKEVDGMTRSKADSHSWGIPHEGLRVTVSENPVGEKGIIPGKMYVQGMGWKFFSRESINKEKGKKLEINRRCCILMVHDMQQGETQ